MTRLPPPMAWLAIEDELDWPEQEPADLEAYRDEEGEEALTAAERNPSMMHR